jgi:tetratricopeptide (TPR) repeat protein
MTGVNPVSGQAPAQALASAGQQLGLLFAWPLLLLILVWVLRWPPSLRAAGLAVLAATTGRGAAVWLAHLLAVVTTLTPASEGKLWILADPVDWAIVIFGVLLCARAWRLADDARQILPPEFQAATAARRAGSGLLLALSGVYALSLVGLIGYYRYHASAYLLQPGIDTRREREALLAQNEGADQFTNGDLDGAERSLQQASRLWEGLTTGRPSPPTYRANLALTLDLLAWIRKQQGRAGEAQQYFGRAVALADELGADPQVSDRFRLSMDEARAELAELRTGAATKVLDEKGRDANRKYEEAYDKADNGEAEAEGLFKDAIALWEEVLPQATNPEYQRRNGARLADAYFRLGDLQLQQGKRAEAEESLKKGIPWGEKAADQDPAASRTRRDVEKARRALDGLREQTWQEEIDKLCTEQRFAEAARRFLQGVADQEEQVQLAADHDAAVRRLAYRRGCFARFLAHCPDDGVRDTKEAVRQAREATRLQPDAADYWYTLALVQYRNGDWGDSLASLETLKARDKDGGFEAFGWLLTAMNRFRLGQKEQAAAALRKAEGWIEDQRRKAEGEPLLQFQHQMLLHDIEPLRREAKDLIQGKDGSGDRVG